jgi:hypothetical protein
MPPSIKVLMQPREQTRLYQKQNTSHLRCYENQIVTKRIEKS